MTNPDVKGGEVGFISGSGLGWTVGLWAQLIAKIAATMEIHPNHMIFVNMPFTSIFSLTSLSLKALFPGEIHFS